MVKRLQQHSRAPIAFASISGQAENTHTQCQGVLVHTPQWQDTLGKSGRRSLVRGKVHIFELRVIVRHAVVVHVCPSMGHPAHEGRTTIPRFCNALRITAQQGRWH